jgi:hypothetical protein
MPLQHYVVREKRIRNKLADFTLIHNRQLEKVRMRGGHGWGEGSQQHEVKASTKEKIAGKLEKKWRRRKE